MTTTFADLGYFIFGLYSFALILTGTPLNLFCFYLFKRIVPNRNNATIIVFSYLAIIEFLIPFTWNLNFAARELIIKHRKNLSFKNLEQYSLLLCKLLSYSAYFSLQCAAWFKTFATFTRCVSLHNEWSIKTYFSKTSFIHCISLLIILFIALINLPILIINGKRVHSYDKYNNTQIQIKCYQSVFFQYWEIVHLLLYNFIPFTLMIIFNISIIRHVHASQRRTRRSKLCSNSIVKASAKASHAYRRGLSTSGIRLTNTLIFVTTSFILLTAPSAIFYISLGKIIKRHRNLITMGLSNLATTCHVMSFVIYWFASIDFRDAIINFCCRRSNMIPRQSADDKPLDNRSYIRPSLSPLKTTTDFDDTTDRKYSLFQS